MRGALYTAVPPERALARLLELLGESKAFVSRDHQRPDDLVARDREIAVRICARLLVLLKRQLDECAAPLVAALAEERDRRLEIELARTLGDPFVRLPEDVLRLQLRPPLSTAETPVPRSPKVTPSCGRKVDSRSQS
jgi:hypothetical protein